MNTFGFENLTPEIFIEAIEDELGIKLFNRSSRRVELSHGGKIFLPEARGIIKRADEASMLMRSLSKGQKGYLPIGFNEPAINTFLPEAIKEFIKLYPDVRLSLDELDITEQFNALEENRINLGFVRPFGHDISAYEKRLVLREEYVLALPENHRLCASPSVNLPMVRNEALIIFPRSGHPRLRDRFDQCFKESGLEPDIVQEIISKHTTLALVRAGIGLAFVPASTAVYAPEGVEFRKVESDLPEVEIFALWHKNAYSPLVNNFLDLVPTQNTKE